MKKSSGHSSKNTYPTNWMHHQKLKEYSIKFRPNKPASPHLNGKVERSQKTDKAEFYATVDLSTDDLKEMLAVNRLGNPGD